jgi:hypothetical protein
MFPLSTRRAENDLRGGRMIHGGRLGVSREVDYWMEFREVLTPEQDEKFRS